MTRAIATIGWLTVPIVFVLACALAVAPAAAAPAPALTLAGCVGDLRGCTPTTPRDAVSGSLSGVSSVAVTPNERQLYVLGDGTLSHFALGRDGVPRFDGCIGALRGCTALVPAGAVGYPNAPGGPAGLAISPDGRYLYAVLGGFDEPKGPLALVSGEVSEFAVADDGKLTLVQCLGTPRGCVPAVPEIALDDPTSIALAPDGAHLYLSTSDADGPAFSEVSIDPDGGMELEGCSGPPDCTGPVGDLVGLSVLAITPDGDHLLAGLFDLDDFNLDAAGDPVFAGCLGALGGCRHTNPIGVLDEVNAIAVSPHGDGAYVGGDAISQLTVGPTGEPLFLGCTGEEPGCRATGPRGVLQGAAARAVAPDGRELYLTSDDYTTSHSAVIELALDGAGRITFAGCVGVSPGCAVPIPRGAIYSYSSGLAVTADGSQLYVLGAVLSHFTVGPAPVLSIAGRARRLGARLVVTVACRGPAGQRCSGTATLYAHERAGRRAGRRVPSRAVEVAVGGTSFAVACGRARRVTVALTGARRLLAPVAGLRVTIRVSQRRAAETLAAGARALTLSPEARAR